MVMPVILASGSEIRAQMLRQVGVDFDVQIARVDEQMIKKLLLLMVPCPVILLTH